MATRTRKKMIRRRQASSARMMGTKWKQSQSQTDTPVIGAVESTSLEMEKSRSLGLKDSDSPYHLQMVGQKVLVEEEPMEATPDAKYGLTQDVCDALAAGRLVLSDQSEYALIKYPFRGTVLSVGGRCNWVKVGYRILFAPFGVQRIEFRGKQFLIMNEEDVHGPYVIQTKEDADKRILILENIIKEIRSASVS